MQCTIHRVKIDDPPDLLGPSHDESDDGARGDRSNPDTPRTCNSSETALGHKTRSDILQGGPQSRKKDDDDLVSEHFLIMVMMHWGGVEIDKFPLTATEIRLETAPIEGA